MIVCSCNVLSDREIRNVATASTSATAERTSSLRLPRLQHAVRALRPNLLTKARVGKRLLHYRISIRSPLRKHDRLFVAQVRTVQGAARWHCVRYVMAITKKRFSLPNCTKRTAHS